MSTPDVPSVGLRDAVVYARGVHRGFAENERPHVAEALTLYICLTYHIDYGIRMVRVFMMVMGGRPVPDTDADFAAYLDQ